MVEQPAAGRFDGKVVVVTGAGAGIGRDMTLAFAREGARLAIGARRVGLLEETAELAEKEPGQRPLVYQTDVTQEEQVDRLVDSAVAELGRLDIAVSNAASPGKDLYLWEQTLEAQRARNWVASRVRRACADVIMYRQLVRIASDRARFSTSYLRTGLPVVDGLAVLLPAAIGTSRALELLYTSRVIDAQEAERIGLVSRVVPAEKLRDSVRELAEEIAAGPPIAQRLTKHLVTTAQRQAYEAHLPYQLYAMHVNRSMGRHDLDEGLSAFREKRKPVFRGR